MALFCPIIAVIGGDTIFIYFFFVSLCLRVRNTLWLRFVRSLL